MSMMSHEMNAPGMRNLLVLLTATAGLLGCPLALAQAAPTTATVTAKVSPVAPRKEQIQAIVQEAYNKFKGETRGKNADYIPELAKVDSKLFGIAIVTTDNQSVTVGDTKTRVFDSVDRQGVLAGARDAGTGSGTRSSRRSVRSRRDGRSTPRWRWSICRRTPATPW